MGTQHSNIVDYLSNRANLVNQYITHFLPQKNVPKELKEAMEYSLLAGGKRVRPILAMAAYESLKKEKIEEILPIIINLELLHTYSLIHDDLPAMDNDDYRRGKLTNHKVYGEAIAILAGDALLTHAFGNMAKALRSFTNLSIDRRLQIIEEFAHFTGAAGMVGGQVVDLKAEQEKASFENLLYIHTHKTGDLIVFSIRLGAMLAGATDEQLEHFTNFGRKIGLAFQIQDDILDLVGDSNKLGKKVGSDTTNNKVTYPFFKGIDISKEEVLNLTNEGKKAIENIGITTDYLYDLADYLIYREV